MLVNGNENMQLFRKNFTPLLGGDYKANLTMS